MSIDLTSVYSHTTKEELMYQYAPYTLEDCFLPSEIPDPWKAVRNRFDPTLSQAIHNFMWLAVPEMDAMNKAEDWVSAVNGMTREVADFVSDVVEDEVLFRKLLMHPKDFHTWWQDEDHSVYDFYDQHGMDVVNTISRRALEAAERIGGYVVDRTDNVIKVNFKKVA